MTSSTSQSGRPPSLADDDRKSLILKGAERVFEQFGYGDATMEEVARACGMAKKTVYKFYPDKAALFSALVQSHDVVAVSEELPKPGLATDMLARMLRELAAIILSPRQITLTRLVIAESVKSPELAGQFYRDCIEKTVSQFTQALTSDPSLKLPADVDPRILADMVISTVLGGVHLRALMLNLEKAQLEAELRLRIDIATHLISRIFPGTR
jgi:AcrR family transcriptional regulator